MNVGIIGGGQLARMLALAAYPLGLQVQILDPDNSACAGQVAPLIQGSYGDKVQLARLADWADVITFDFENVPADTARFLEQHVAFYPPAHALAVAQDRLSEKNLFEALRIPIPPFAAISSLDDLRHAVQQLALPAVLKTCRLGYDGKGQYILRTRNDIEPAWQELGGVPLILERFVPFAREVSMLAVQGKGQQHKGKPIAFYPLVENFHRDGILCLSKAPFFATGLEDQAHRYAHALLDALDYVGVLAIEFFVTEDGQLIANEIAPRVHNTGHWTIEGAITSQFENHLRAILGLPLGSTTAIGYSAMLNSIGTMPEQATGLAIPDVHYHSYGKVPRPGRKVGHLTLQVTEPHTLRVELAPVLSLMGYPVDEFD